VFEVPHKTLQKIYALTSEVAPLGKEDCGQLCDSACCSNRYGEKLGIYLLPGEEKMLKDTEGWLSWEKQRSEFLDFPLSWRGEVYFVNCYGICHRHLRPLQCRFFPLAPHFEDNELWLILETIILPYKCPLIDKNIPLSADFINAILLSWKLLWEVKEMRDLVHWDSKSHLRRKIKPRKIKRVMV